MIAYFKVRINGNSLGELADNLTKNYMLIRESENEDLKEGMFEYFLNELKKGETEFLL